jgi:uncharacterized protein YoxC
MYGDMQEMKGDIRELKTDVAGLKTDVAELKASVRNLEERVDENTEKINGLYVLVENSICPALKLIAENHCTLNDKLNKALKDQPYFNTVEVRLDVLEADVHILKQRIGA